MKPPSVVGGASREVPPAHANMADVAAQAEVSIATVSRALRGLPGVAEETRARVLRVADDLAYVVSPAASGLSGRTTGRIAVVVPRLDAWFQSTVVAAVEATVRESGFDVLVYQVDGETQRRRFFQSLPARRKVDAVVLVALPLRPEEAARLDLLATQVVVAGGRLHDHPHVEVDDHALAVALTDHLLDLGHTDIGFVRTLDTEGAEWSSDLNRVQGWRDAQTARGLVARDDLLVSEPYGVAAGARGMARLLDADRPPTAVLCFSDEIAVAAVGELSRRGLRVPQHMSLAGVDGHPLAELFGITSVVQDVAAQGRIAAELAVALISGDVVDDPSVEVPWRLVDRGSTGRPPRSD